MQFTTTILSAITLGALAVSAAPLDKRSNSGRATWYTQDGTTGSCGQTHSDSSHVIAVPEWMGLSHCGDSVTIEYDGKTVEAVVADTCPECSGHNIDLSRGTFGDLASYSQGEMEVKWWFS